MRVALASLLLAACATSGAPPSPADRVSGCWTNRDQAASSMRWQPDPGRTGVMHGARTDLAAAGAAHIGRFTLAQEGEGWRLCRIEDDSEAGQCWAVAEGEGGSLEGGRAFIDNHRNRLRITIIGAGPTQTIFQGRRVNCD